MTRDTKTDGPPLARLFAIAYRELIDDLHDRLRESGWHDVRPAFGFVLLAARDGPTSVVEVGSLLGVSKQAASKLVDVMVASGYIARTASADDRRHHPLHLTSRGRALLDAVEQIYAELENQWADVIGASQVERLRRDLSKVLARKDGQLPTVRSPTGTSDDA